MQVFKKRWEYQPWRNGRNFAGNFIFPESYGIYETVFEFEPDMIEAKKQELLGTYAQAGLYLGEKLLTKEGDI